MAVSTLGFASRGGAILGMCFFGVGSLSYSSYSFYFSEHREHPFLTITKRVLKNKEIGRNSNSTHKVLTQNEILTWREIAIQAWENFLR